MRIYPQFILWTYLILPAICLFLTPGLFAGLVKAQLHKAKIMSNIMNAKAKAAAAIAKNHAKHLERRWLPENKFSRGQKPFHLRTRRDVDVSMNNENQQNSEVFKRNTHWDQQEESMGQLQNMWNMNNFGSMQNLGLLRQSHTTDPKEIEPPHFEQKSADNFDNMQNGGLLGQFQTTDPTEIEPPRFEQKSADNFDNMQNGGLLGQFQTTDPTEIEPLHFEEKSADSFDNMQNVGLLGQFQTTDPTEIEPPRFEQKSADNFDNMQNGGLLGQFQTTDPTEIEPLHFEEKSADSFDNMQNVGLLGQFQTTDPTEIEPPHFEQKSADADPTKKHKHHGKKGHGHYFRSSENDDQMINEDESLLPSEMDMPQFKEKSADADPTKKHKHHGKKGHGHHFRSSENDGQMINEKESLLPSLEEFRPNADVVGIPRSYDNAKHGNAPNSYTGPFFGRNVYDEVIAQANPIIVTELTDEMLEPPFARSKNPSYYRSNDDEAQLLPQEFQMISLQPPEFMEPKSANPDPHHKLKKWYEHTYSYGYYPASDYYRRNNENEDMIGAQQMIPSDPNAMDANTSPIEHQKSPDFMAPKSANPDPHHHHKKWKKHKTYSDGYYPSSGYYGRNNENEDIIGDQQMNPNDPKAMDANTSPIEHQNEDIIGAANVNIPQQMIPNEPDITEDSLMTHRLEYAAKGNAHDHHNHDHAHDDVLGCELDKDLFEDKHYDNSYFDPSTFYQRAVDEVSEINKKISEAASKLPPLHLPSIYPDSKPLGPEEGHSEILEPQVAYTSSEENDVGATHNANGLEPKSAHPHPHSHGHSHTHTHTHTHTHNKNLHKIKGPHASPLILTPASYGVPEFSSTSSKAHAKSITFNHGGTGFGNVGGFGHSKSEAGAAAQSGTQHGFGQSSAGAQAQANSQNFNGGGFGQSGLGHFGSHAGAAAQSGTQHGFGQSAAQAQAGSQSFNGGGFGASRAQSSAGANAGTHPFNNAASQANAHSNAQAGGGYGPTGAQSSAVANAAIQNFNGGGFGTSGGQSSAGANAATHQFNNAAYQANAQSNAQAGEGYGASGAQSSAGANRGGLGTYGTQLSAGANAQSFNGGGLGTSGAQSSAGANTQNFNGGGFGTSGAQSSAVANPATQPFNNAASQANAQVNAQSGGGFGASGAQSSAGANRGGLGTYGTQLSAGANAQSFNGGGLGTSGAQSSAGANAQNFNGGFGTSGAQSSAVANPATQPFNNAASQANAQANAQSGGGFGTSGAQSSASANTGAHSILPFALPPLVNNGGYGPAGFGQAGSQANAGAASQGFNGGGFGQSSAQAAAQAQANSGVPPFFQVLGPSNFLTARSEDGNVDQPMKARQFVMPHIDEIPVSDLMHEMEGEADRFPRSQDSQQDIFGGLNLASSIVRTSLNGKALLDQNKEQHSSGDAQKTMDFVTGIVDASLKAGESSDQNDAGSKLDRFTRSTDSNQNVLGGLNLASSIVHSSLNGGQIPQSNSASAQNPMGFVTGIVDSSLGAGNPSNQFGFNNDQIEEDMFTNPRVSNQNVFGGPNVAWSIVRDDESPDDQKTMKFITHMVESNLKAKNGKKTDKNLDKMSKDDLTSLVSNIVESILHAKSWKKIQDSTLAKNQTNEQTIADDLNPDDPKFREELKKEIMAFINDPELRQRELMNLESEKDQIRRTKDLRQDLVGLINLPSTIVRSNLENTPLLHLNRDQAADTQKTMNFVTDIVDSSLKIGQQANQHKDVRDEPVDDNWGQNESNKNADSLETTSKNQAAETQKTMGFVADIVDSSLKAGQQVNQHKNEPADKNSLETARDATFQGISSISGIVNDGLHHKIHARDLRQDLVEILHLPSTIVENSPLLHLNQGAISGNQAAEAAKTMNFVTDIVDSSLKVGQLASQRRESADENLNQNEHFRNAGDSLENTAADAQKTMGFVSDIVDSSLKVGQHNEPANTHIVNDVLRHKRQFIEETVGKHGPDTLLRTSNEPGTEAGKKRRQKKGKRLSSEEMNTTEYVTIEPWASNWDYKNNREKFPHEMQPQPPKPEEKSDVNGKQTEDKKTGGQKKGKRISSEEMNTTEYVTIEPWASNWDYKNNREKFPHEMQPQTPKPEEKFDVNGKQTEDKETGGQKKGKRISPEQMITTEYVTIEPWASNWDYKNNREKFPHEMQPQTPKPEKKSDVNVKQPEEALNNKNDSIIVMNKDDMVGSQPNWKRPGTKLNEVKEFSKFDKVANEKIESDADLHGEKLEARQLEMKDEKDADSSSEEDKAEDGPKAEIEPKKPISTLTLDEIEDIQFREPFNATGLPENPDFKIPIPLAPAAVEENANHDNTKPSENAIQQPPASIQEIQDLSVNHTAIDAPEMNQSNASDASPILGSSNPTASSSFLDKDNDAKGKGTANEEPVQIFSLSMMGIAPNRSGFLFNASGGPFDSIEAEMKVLTEEEKESFIKQEMALISEVFEETLKKDDFWGKDSKKEESKEPKQEHQKDQVVSSPNLFRSFEHWEHERHARSAANPEELDAILGAQREKLEDIHNDAMDDGDLLMISFIGDGILKDLEQRRDKALENSSTKKSVVSEPNIKPAKRTKRKIAGLKPTYFPITRLVNDPTTKIDVPRTLDNVGAVVRHTFESPRAPIYHVRSLIGNTKNTIMSAAKVPPNNILVPSQYEIAKLTGDKTLGAINQHMLNSRSGDDNVERAVEGDSLGIMDTFNKIGNIVRDSVQSGKDVVLHATDAATDARNALYTAKHAAPRLLLPSHNPLVVSRISDVDSSHLENNKAVLIAPRLLDINENVVGAVRQQPDQFVGMGHILDAVGFTNPNPLEVELQEIVFDPTTMMRPRKSRSLNAVKRWTKDVQDSLKAPNNAEGSLWEAEESVGANNLKDFSSKMLQEMKEISTSQQEDRKRRRIEKVKEHKSRSSFKKDQKLVKKKTTRQIHAPNVDPIQKPNTEATVPPEVLKVFTDDIPKSTNEPQNPQQFSDAQNETVGLYLPPELMKPFMGQPSADLLNSFMRENGDDEVTVERESSDIPKVFPVLPLNMNVTIPMNGMNLSTLLPVLALLGAPTPKEIEVKEVEIDPRISQTFNSLSETQHREDAGHVLGAINPMMFERHSNEGLRRTQAESGAARHRGTDEILGSSLGIVSDDTKEDITIQLPASLINQQRGVSNNQHEMNQNNVEEQDPNAPDQTGRTSMTIPDVYQQPFMGSISHDRVHEFLNQYNNNMPENGNELEPQENPSPVKNVVFSDDEYYNDYIM